MACVVVLVAAAQDPWENVELGQKLFASRPCVTEFVRLPGIGHCPQDEAPEVVNPLVDRFVRATAKQANQLASAAAV